MTVELTPTSQSQPARDQNTAHTRSDDALTEAARRLYDAELALHDAHQSHVDAWITAAADRLHNALVEHLQALASAHRGGGR